MDFKRVKKDANSILKNKSIECEYIEYKKSDSFLDKILKTICAYANNYYDNDIQYLFIGVDEENNSNNKATPKLPISGIKESQLEIVENKIKSIKPYIYPNVDFEVLKNDLDGVRYILIVVERQSKGPYQVNENGEKKLGVRPGRYIRVESTTRLAKVNEEYDLLRKFSNYHFDSEINNNATIDDLDFDCIKEYISSSSDRNISKDLDKVSLLESLDVLDKNDPTKTRIKNFGLLMFSYNLNIYIHYAYVDMIIDKFGSKRKMEVKTFKGPIWKVYYSLINYINDNFLNTITIRNENIATNRKVSNFPFVAIEELVANAIVHNNYENINPIQIYVSDKEISIVNYNKPLPPITLDELNNHSFFKARDIENPKIREMFKSIGIIEDYGTGIGEAKKALKENGSPNLYYEEFNSEANVTSVTIPVNVEYYNLKYGEEKKEETISFETRNIKELVINSKYSSNVKKNIMRIIDSVKDNIFGNKEVMDIVGCSQVTATSYLNKLNNELHIIEKVKGAGKGKYIVSR